MTPITEKIKTLTLVLMAGALLVASVEVWSVRTDHDALRFAYGTFLASRVKGKPLSDMIRPDSLAVFRSEKGILACAMLKGE